MTNLQFIALISINGCLLLIIFTHLKGRRIANYLQKNYPNKWKDLGKPQPQLTVYFITTFLTIIIGTPIAFFAIWSEGYLAPLGFVALVLVFSQIIAATGYGYYFPWSIPGLYSGAGGEAKEQLNMMSYLILILTSVFGYIATISYWKYADQTK